MFKRKDEVRAEFCRDGSPCIIVDFPQTKLEVYILAGIVDRSSEVLGEKELVEVINILNRERGRMIKQHNFPLIYQKMLSELWEAHRKRYMARE